MSEPTEPFVEVPLRPRFFEASAFFPLPVVLAATRAEGGPTNLAPYSHVFPRVDEPATLVLVARAETNTARNAMRTGRLSLCFIPDEPRLLDNCKVLGVPGDTEHKMARSVFTLVPSPSGEEGAPELPEEAVQVFECRVQDVSRVAEGRAHLRLKVEHVWLKPQLRAALEAGRGFPRLPVDYGFREPTSSWLSRPRTYESGPRLRPRFETVVPRPPGELLAAFKQALARETAPVAGQVVGHHVQLTVRERDRTFWSPHMEVVVEPHEEGSEVFARIGPHPYVWTMFLGLHALVGFSWLGALMFGLSQWTAGESAWALWAIPAGLFLHAFIAGGAFIGQGLGADQIYQLRAFMDEILAAP